MTKALAFLQAISRGDLVLATNYASEKLHLIRLTYSQWEQEPEKGDKELTLWSGYALCGLGNRYYYRPRETICDDEGRCRVCFQKWRGQGKPPVKGWTQTIVDPRAGAGWPLPFGWRELSIGKHPYDVPPDGDPTPIVDGTGKVCGQRRTELRRWQRGNYVVRIVEYHGEEKRGAFGVRAHDVRTECSERGRHYGSQPDCVREAWILMARGGRP